MSGTEARCSDRRPSRLRPLLAAAAVLAFVVALALSTMRGQLPAGGQGAYVRDDRISIDLTAITGETVSIPGGRPGALLFMASAGCPSCASLTRKLSRVAQTESSSPQVTVVSLDSVDSRSDFERFADAAGNPNVAYTLDDRGGSLNGLFAVRELGTIVVYDRTGAVLGRVTPGVPRLVERIGSLLRSAGREPAAR